MAAPKTMPPKSTPLQLVVDSASKKQRKKISRIVSERLRSIADDLDRADSAMCELEDGELAWEEEVSGVAHAPGHSDD